MSKAPTSVEKVIFIDTCRDCKKHRSSTWHDESKYEANYNQVKTALETLIPGVQVQKKLDETVNIGAFEVTHKGKVLFSKKTSGLWPNAKAVAPRVKSYFDDIEGGHDVSHYGKQKEVAYIPKRLHETRTFSGTTGFDPKGMNQFTMSQSVSVDKPTSQLEAAKLAQKPPTEHAKEKAAEPIHIEEPKKEAVEESKAPQGEAKAHTEETHEAKPEAQPEAKTETQPEAKAETKPEEAPKSQREAKSSEPASANIEKKDAPATKEEPKHETSAPQAEPVSATSEPKSAAAQEHTEPKSATAPEHAEQKQEAPEEAKKTEETHKEAEEKHKEEHPAEPASAASQKEKVENSPALKEESSATVKKSDEAPEEEYSQDFNN